MMAHHPAPAARPLTRPPREEPVQKSRPLRPAATAAAAYNQIEIIKIQENQFVQIFSFSRRRETLKRMSSSKNGEK
jgi:hypothetical protein